MQTREVTRLWLPGQGVVDLAPMKIHRAVQAYDERLMFGRITDESHPGYGDWVVFVKMPHGQTPVPVLGFGNKELPSIEEVLRRADEANTRKHGQALIDAMHREQLQRKAEAEKESERLAELYADIMKEAEGVKNPMISVPKGI